MSCVHSTPAQGRSRGRAPVFLIRDYPRLPGFPSDVYGIMTQRSDCARLRPYAGLDQALHTLGGYVLLVLVVHSGFRDRDISAGWLLKPEFTCSKSLLDVYAGTFAYVTSLVHSSTELEFMHQNLEIA